MNKELIHNATNLSFKELIKFTLEYLTDYVEKWKDHTYAEVVAPEDNHKIGQLFSRFDCEYYIIYRVKCKKNLWNLDVTIESEDGTTKITMTIADKDDVSFTVSALNKGILTLSEQPESEVLKAIESTDVFWGRQAII